MTPAAYFRLFGVRLRPGGTDILVKLVSDATIVASP